MRTAVVTGGNTGIGLETAAALTAQGFNTIIACRSAEKGKVAAERIRSRVIDAKIETRVLDLADFESIQQFAKTLVDTATPIDVLINNAGIMACPKMKTKDGLEMQMGVNHMGHFLLTSMLYPLMKNHKNEARIVNVSSMAHKLTRGVNFEDINNEKAYKRWDVYCQSKLANVLFTYELARRIPKEANVIANVCHPGVVATELQRHLAPKNFLLRPLVTLINSLIKTPEQGAQTSIYLGTSPEVANVTGKYFQDSKESKSQPLSYVVEDAKKLWGLSEQLTGAKWKF